MIDIWGHTAVDEVIVGSAAVVAASGLIWRQALRPAWRWLKSVGKTLDWLHHELSENSGSSTKDAVLRIDERTKRLEEAVRTMQRDLYGRATIDS